MNDISSWDLIVAEKFEEAAAKAKEEYESEKLSPYLYNRVLALLNLKKYHEAYLDCETLLVDCDSDNHLILAGLCQWGINNYKGAIEIWERGVKDYPVEGIEIPALLYFASIVTNNAELKRESIKLLSKLWRKINQKGWPAPIAGLLLGKQSLDQTVVSLRHAQINN